jgi:hypothetical protein
MTEQDVQQRIGQLMLTLWQLDKALQEAKMEIAKLRAEKEVKPS